VSGRAGRILTKGTCDIDDDEGKLSEGQRISSRNARGGEVILRTRRRRVIFLAGLAGFVVLSALGGLALAIG
jgi:hypothetical protein